MNQARRQYYLNAMGIQNWQLKSVEDVCFTEEDALEPETIVHDTQKLDIITPQRIEPEVTVPEISPEVEVPEVIIPEVKISRPVSNNPERAEISFDVPPSELEQSIKACKLCSSRQTRLNALAGQGSSDANVFVISEAPSAEEDRSGHYLNEQTRSLLQSMFQCIDVHESFFLTGILKCFSQTDYLYSEDEVSHCSQFLYAQIEQLKPQVILVWGASQAQAILQTKKSFNELRGQVHHASINKQEYPLVVSYHPAYLLRNPLYKHDALNDLIMLQQVLND